MIVKSLFLSDLHLGSPLSKPLKIISMLNKYEGENLFLVGDIIDIKDLKKDFSHGEMINVIFNMFRLKFDKIYYIEGNHERGFFSKSKYVNLDKIQLSGDYIVHNINGDDYVVTHGHLLDLDIAVCRGIIPLFMANIIKDDLNNNEEIFASVCKKVREGRENYLNSYRTSAMNYSNMFKKKIICGHSHSQQIYKCNNSGNEYYNIGDFKHNSTYMIETKEGSLELKYEL